MDALHRVARDCRALLVSIQLTLLAPFVGPSFSLATLFVVLRAVVVSDGVVESALY